MYHDEPIPASSIEHGTPLSFCCLCYTTGFASALKSALEPNLQLALEIVYNVNEFCLSSGSSPSNLRTWDRSLYIAPSFVRICFLICCHFELHRSRREKFRLGLTGKSSAIWRLPRTGCTGVLKSRAQVDFGSSSPFGDASDRTRIMRLPCKRWATISTIRSMLLLS